MTLTKQQLEDNLDILKKRILDLEEGLEWALANVPHEKRNSTEFKEAEKALRPG